uniref:TNFR-Cys domain-containing protein n=1 Tax=Anser brachyrhynchus TaxID=132585 RepID=A0A8B9CDE5_9AVES
IYIITIQEFRTFFLAISFEMVHKMSQAILKAGTFVVSAGCGRGAGCRQCPPDTFSSAAGLRGCTLCRKCEGRFRYLKACSPKSDAECTCKEGYRCSGDGCSRCDRSCGVGEESAGMHTTPEQSVQEDACSCRFPEEEQGEYQDCGKSTEFRDLLEN